MRKFALVTVLSLLAFSPRVSLAQVRYMPGTRATIAPPAPRYEMAPPAPSLRHQWIPGYWAWRGTAHVWLGGHWALPPAYGYVWELARWEMVNGAWMFFDGHWRPMDQPDPAQAYQPPPPPMNEVIAEAPPPVPIEEVRPAPPFERAVWIPGYWHWSGVRYVWAVGRWSPRPAGYEWEEHRWDRREDGRWVQRYGHWHPRDDEGHHRQHDEHHDDEGRHGPEHR